MDVETLMRQAGFRENTSVDKAKGLIVQGKWHPSTKESKKATEQLKEFFMNREVEQTVELIWDQHQKNTQSMKVKRWGELCGFLARNDLTKEQIHHITCEKNMLEDELLEDYSLDVRSWGSPLSYDVQSE